MRLFLEGTSDHPSVGKQFTRTRVKTVLRLTHLSLPHPHPHHVSSTPYRKHSVACRPCATRHILESKCSLRCTYRTNKKITHVEMYLVTFWLGSTFPPSSTAGDGTSPFREPCIRAAPNALEQNLASYPGMSVEPRFVAPALRNHHLISSARRL